MRLQLHPARLGCVTFPHLDVNRRPVNKRDLSAGELATRDLSAGELSTRDLSAGELLTGDLRYVRLPPEELWTGWLELRISQDVEVRNFVFYCNCIPRRSKIVCCTSAEIKLFFAFLCLTREKSGARQDAMRSFTSYRECRLPPSPPTRHLTIAKWSISSNDSPVHLARPGAAVSPRRPCPSN